MKTSELIEKLKELDPAGDLDVTVNNIPIYIAEKLPAYYDGPKHELIQDTKLPGYNVTGYKITNKGFKIKLHVLDLESFLTDNNSDQVDLSDLSGRDLEYYKTQISEFAADVEAVEELISLERHF